MSTTITYPHSASLRQRYINELDDALHDNRLRNHEQAWLKSATQAFNDADADPIRIDRLILNDGTCEPFELAAALLLSHNQSENPQVYLYTLARGIEAFNDRHALSNVLRERYGEEDGNALFEYEKIDGDPFRAQMLAIVEHQVAQLGHLTAQLKKIPSLQDASTASLAQQMRDPLAHIPVNPETHLLQIVSGSENETPTIVVTQTLAQGAFDDCCKIQVAEDFKRRFLDARGLPANSTDSDLYTQALANAKVATGEHYARLLRAFWEGVWCEKHTRRDLAVESLKGSLRRELYGHRYDSLLNSHTLKPLFALLQTEPGDFPTDTVLRCSRLSIKIGDSISYPLAGTFLVQPGRDDDESILWFSSDHRLVRFTDRAALAAYFATAPGREQLRPMLAIEDQSVLLQQGQLQLDLEPIRTPLFADRVDSIIALQARNLAHVMGLPSTPEYVVAMIDDALDVRRLLDPRQLQFSAGRWRKDAPFDFAHVWLTPQPDTSVPPPAAGTSDDSMPPPGEPNADASVSSPLTSSWLERSQDLDLRADRLRHQSNVLSEHAVQLLQQYLCVLSDGSVRPEDVRVRWPDTTPVVSSGVEPSVPAPLQFVSTDLVTLLLERVSGLCPPLLAPGAQILFGASSAPAPVEADLINYVLDRAAVDFAKGYLLCFKQSRVERQRQGNLQMQPARDAVTLREQAMRLDLSLRKRQNVIDDAAFDMARQALDRPVRSLRMALDEPVAEAFSVSLAYADHPGAALCDTMVLRQPLVPTSPVMLWSCELGWRQFPSIERLQALLQRELHTTSPQRWLDLLGERDRTLLRNHLLTVPDDLLQIRLDRVDGHAINALQERVLDRQQEDLRQLCRRAVRCRLEAGLFADLARATELDRQLSAMLDGLSVRIDNSLSEALLPPWICTASIADLKLYLHLWTRYFLAVSGGKDFLFDVPVLEDYSHAQLVKQLNIDFPGQLFNPCKITVTSRRYITALPAAGQLPSAVPAATIGHSESLTEYAVNRFVYDQGAILSIQSAEQPQAASLLTPAYVQRLVRTLDVGTGFMALLARTLAPDDPSYPVRKRLFVEQLPPMMLEVALSDKLKGNLSKKAYDFISRVFDMPDGIAREPVDGTRVILSPLQLVADVGMTPDTVSGVYLICPAAAHAGPVVMYASQHPGFIFREYASQSALLDDVRKEDSLQQLLLERLDPEVRRRYAHGGFVEPHLPFSVEGFNEVPLRSPGPVRLELTEVQGNALQYLFAPTIRLLLDMGVSNIVTNEQATRADRIFLATLGLEQTMTLLPGKLAALVGLWQSHTLFRASAASVSGRRWGEALSEFSAALGVMVSTREQAIEEMSPEEQVSTELSPGIGEENGAPSAFSWGDSALNAEQRLRLRGLEAKYVALNEMQHDDLLNLYLDKKNGTQYAVVAGKVYQVKSVADQGEWFIVGAHGTSGPMVALDENQRWQLNLNLRLRGGGGILTKDTAGSADALADETLVVEARGMPQIRLRFRDRARRIGEAHLQAKRYLENCLDNLNVHQRGAPLDPRVNQIISDFFGVRQPSQELMTQIESHVKSLFDAVMADSLAPFSSPRFVIGTNRPGHEAVTAFVIKGDPHQRIFLTEQFFTVPPLAVKPQAGAQGFDFPDHYRAATLIHELSHQTLNTYDIAYLDSMAPFPDLLRENNAENVEIRAQVARLQDGRLSHRSSKKTLFMRFENGQWRDITHNDSCGFEAILQLTNTYDLHSARDVFLSDAAKRSQVMLKNADSLTLLILRLGRHNYVVPSP